jgi:basic amino acid/polyamine antiporter, APA family
MTFVRSIGRWAMTGLIINGIIGSGFFGVPGELTRLLGRASPIAMLIAALVMAIIMAVITEVASQFSDPGGPYLYVRTALGPFVGVQVGWFWLLSIISAVAACADLFVGYLAVVLPSVGHGWERTLAITALIAIPAFANSLGVRSGANFCNLLTVAKLLPLGLLIVLGLFRFGGHFQMIRTSEIAQPGWGAWLKALLLLLYVFGGYEDSLAPMGEVKDPRKTVPFGLATGLLVCAIVYALLQFVSVAATGTMATDRPLVETAILLLGRGGALFVSVAVMISSYGYVAGSALNAPRIAYSFSAQGDFPRFLSRLHPQYHTPVLSICIYSALVWGLALSGTFLWVAAVSAGSMAVYYAAICAALIRLQKIQPNAPALRLPCGSAFAVVGIGICGALLSRLSVRQALLMGVTALIASGNWWWARHRSRGMSRAQKGAEVPA